MFAFLFLQVELFFFLSRMLHKFTFLPQENGVLTLKESMVSPVFQRLTI